MSGFTNFLGSVAGQVATRVILNKVMQGGGIGLRDIGPPGYELPIQIPPGADVEGAERSPAGTRPRFQIPGWFLLAGYGGLLWYAARATSPPDIPETEAETLDLDSLGQTDLLFPGLKRELTHLDADDLATSDDPVEACLERRGWNLQRIDALRQSMFEKEQTDLFSEGEDFTRSEEELLADIETCMQRLESQYGSLEAAGAGCSLCSEDDPDLGAVQREMFAPEAQEFDFDPKEEPEPDLRIAQREMFDPEQGEFILDPGPVAPKRMRAKEGPDTFWFFIPKGKRKPNLIPEEQLEEHRGWYFSAWSDGKGKLYKIEADTKTKARKQLNDQLTAATQYRKRYGNRQNKFSPWFKALDTGHREGYFHIPNIMAHPQSA